jgi:acyl-CoA synthetase (AMP-forming)/AMP-acid ligase II
MAKLSKEERDEIRKYFDEHTGIIEYSCGYGITETVYDKSDLGTLFIHDNDDDLTYVGVCELLPYESVKEFLRDSKRCGPYIKSMVSKDYYLPTHIIDSEEPNPLPQIYPSIKIKDNYYVSFDDLLKYYIWEKGTFCGEKGKKIRNFI